MIERISDLPETILGFTAKGKVTAQDYETTIIPAVNAMFSRREKVRFLYHLGEGFSSFEPGALWDDAKVGLSHITGWEKLAVVTDVAWIRAATRFFSFAMPGHVRIFHNAALAEAKQWIAA